MSRFAFVGIAALLAGGCATTAPPSPFGIAAATNPIIDTAGRQIGTVTIGPDPRGWGMLVEVAGLPDGQHGIHLHEVGRCDLPDFKTAGGHFNPNQNHHGVDNPNPNRPHRGDMGNIGITGGQGKAGGIQLWDPRIATNGLALVIHADPDDNKTDPSGNSGARIACGVVLPG